MTSIVELNAAQPVKPVSVSSLNQYGDYTRALAVNTPATGFKEFAPRDPVSQAKYDAMQPTWQGIESSDKAIAAGVYALDYATDDRSVRPATQNLLPPAAPPPKKEESGFCVVQ
jgi:hypothetical protein